MSMCLAGSSGQPPSSSAATSTSYAAGARAAPSAGAAPSLIPPEALQNILRIANGGLRTQSGQPGVFCC